MSIMSNVQPVACCVAYYAVK